MPTRIRGIIAIPITCVIATAALVGLTAPARATRLSTGDRIVNAAAAQAGTPYRSGGEGPIGFDCSGLTQYAHKQVGIDLPRTSREQRAAVQGVQVGHATR